MKLADEATYVGGVHLSFDLVREDLPVASGSQLALHPLLRLPAASPLSNGVESLGPWSIEIAESGLSITHPALVRELTIDNQPRWRLEPAAIEDVWIVCVYLISDS